MVRKSKNQKADIVFDKNTPDIDYYDLWPFLRREIDIWFRYHGVGHVMNMHWNSNRQIYSLDDQMFETLTDLLAYGQLESQCIGSVLMDIEDWDVGYVEDYDPFDDEEIERFHGESRDDYLLEAVIWLMKNYEATYLMARKLLEQYRGDVDKAYDEGRSARQCVESLN